MKALGGAVSSFAVAAGMIADPAVQLRQPPIPVGGHELPQFPDHTGPSALRFLDEGLVLVRWTLGVEGGVMRRRGTDRGTSWWRE